MKTTERYLTIQTSTHLIVVDRNINGQKGLNYNFGLSKIFKLERNYEPHSSEWNYCFKIIASYPKLEGVAEFCELSLIDNRKKKWDEHYQYVKPLKDISEFANYAFETLEKKKIHNKSSFRVGVGRGIREAEERLIPEIKAAKSSGKYSEEDMKKCFDAGYERGYEASPIAPDKFKNPDFDDVIQSFNKTLRFEVEEENKSILHKDSTTGTFKQPKIIDGKLQGKWKIT